MLLLFSVRNSRPLNKCKVNINCWTLVWKKQQLFMENIILEVSVNTFWSLFKLSLVFGVVWKLFGDVRSPSKLLLRKGKSLLRINFYAIAPFRCYEILFCVSIAIPGSV